jgi:membrane protein DedA with SNARE-associated domain
LGVPLPEDVPLIAGGYLAFRQGGSLVGMVLTGLAGILIGDSIIFVAGQTYGAKLLVTRFGRRHITGERVQRTIHLFERHGPKFIVVARFVPGLRACTYFVAGTTGVPYWKFILYDGIAACVSAPVWVYLGWWAGQHHMLGRAWTWAWQAQEGILIAIALLSVAWVGGALLRKRRRRKSGQISTPPAVPSLRAVDGPRDRPAAMRRQ